MKNYRNEQPNADDSQWVMDALASLVETKDLQASQLESLQAELAKVSAERDAFKTEAQSLREQLAKATAERYSSRADTQSLHQKLVTQAVFLGNLTAEKTKMQKDQDAMNKSVEAFVAYSESQADYLRPYRETVARLPRLGFKFNEATTKAQPSEKTEASESKNSSVSALYPGDLYDLYGDTADLNSESVKAVNPPIKHRRV